MKVAVRGSAFAGSAPPILIESGARNAANSCALCLSHSYGSPVVELSPARQATIWNERWSVVSRGSSRLQHAHLLLSISGKRQTCEYPSSTSMPHIRCRPQARLEAGTRARPHLPSMEPSQFLEGSYVGVPETRDRVLILCGQPRDGADTEGAGETCSRRRERSSHHQLAGITGARREQHVTAGSRRWPPALSPCPEGPRWTPHLDTVSSLLHA